MITNTVGAIDSSWLKFRDKVTGKLTSSVANRFKNKGVQVFVKTDLGREVLAYDSSNFGNESQSLVKFGVKVKDRDGNVITEYGQYPKTNALKQGLIIGSAVVGAWTIFKGIKNFY